MVNNMRYDVFISFKNTDENGTYTEDSYLAEKLYLALKQENLNAFYSNIVLNEVGAAAYKNAIEDALEQSSVLVSIATKVEYLISQWVSYERESFHNDILSGRKKSACIVPYIKNISGCDVPRSLRNYQTFEIGVSSISDVVSFIKKFINSVKPVGSGQIPLQKESISLSTGKHLFSYKAEIKSELKRLKIQAANTRESDNNAIRYVLAQLAHKDTINILDMGCAYGYVTKDRFANIPGIYLIGVDRSEKLIEYAKENSSFDGASYYVLDL